MGVDRLSGVVLRTVYWVLHDIVWFVSLRLFTQCMWIYLCTTHLLPKVSEEFCRWDPWRGIAETLTALIKTGLKISLITMFFWMTSLRFRPRLYLTCGCEETELSNMKFLKYNLTIAQSICMFTCGGTSGNGSWTWAWGRARGGGIWTSVFKGFAIS